ncbi:hypothetical protein GBAR_LOCUS4370 [Geodia barretti]|uniref:Uncharacterized protein n=1 Tax=Geodia barretti TaxID=519541 RepID=A0AA35R7N8_GEOBA|nr:hypothetical protein GBAR_LOCUS4370 [Geodia barretti]
MRQLLENFDHRAPYSGTSEQGTLWGQRFCPL